MTDTATATSPLAFLEGLFQHLVNMLDAVLFYPIPLPFLGEFPFLVLWLVIGGLFFTFRLGFANIRLIPHAFTVVAESFSAPKKEGRVSSFQAMTAAVSGTVGLGNIAGVAVAISIGGPGAIVWMIIAACLGTATKLAEVTLGHLYRHEDEHGKIHGGPFYYITAALTERGLPKLGKALAIMFCICTIGGALGGGNMLQSHQSVSILTTSFSWLAPYGGAISFFLAVTVAIILIGSITRIVQVTDKLVPIMAIIYVLACITVLWVNSHLILDAIGIMIHEAFSLDAAGGGMVGAMIMGFRRAFFSNEAGIGSAPIAHAATSEKNPVREGVVALLEPLIDTVLICTMTGLVIITTGVYASPELGEGVILTSAAFETVISWFPQVLAVCVVLFAYSTMLTWSYYGEQAWRYLFGARTLKLYYLIFASLTFFGGLIHLGPIVDFGDLILLAMAIPNLIALYLMSDKINEKVQEYLQEIKQK